ncbi:hypothetical protein EPNKCIFM_00013 [Klebsiella phage KP13-16]|nr:hypothetical protein EPNKCIFM_00013 [Klebsiella phage KP13-16]
MHKDTDLIENVIFLLSELEDYVDNLDMSEYDDFNDMKEAQKEVLKLLKNLTRRRENEVQRRRLSC